MRYIKIDDVQYVPNLFFGSNAKILDEIVLKDYVIYRKYKRNSENDGILFDGWTIVAVWNYSDKDIGVGVRQDNGRFKLQFASKRTSFLIKREVYESVKDDKDALNLLLALAR